MDAAPCRLRPGGLRSAHACPLGAPKAVTATARKLAIIIYNMLKYGKAYVDQGAEYFEQQYRAAMVKNLKRRARQLGFEVVQATDTPVAEP